MHVLSGKHPSTPETVSSDRVIIVVISSTRGNFGFIGSFNLNFPMKVLKTNNDLTIDES